MDNVIQLFCEAQKVRFIKVESHNEHIDAVGPRAIDAEYRDAPHIMGKSHAWSDHHYGQDCHR
jgi:hypothetical protein